MDRGCGTKNNVLKGLWLQEELITLQWEWSFRDVLTLADLAQLGATFSAGKCDVEGSIEQPSLSPVPPPFPFA